MGYVSGSVAGQIDDADAGALGKQILNFNVRVSQVNAFGDAYYEKAFTINGRNRFKRYGMLDVLKYKVGRVLNRYLS